jgi:methionyl-tRNA formyltransferase
MPLNTRLKILFFGTSEFSKKILKNLLKEYSIVGVITQPDKPVGRRQEVTSSPVAVFAEENNLQVFKFTNLKSAEAFETVKKIATDLFVVVAYGKIIPKEILDLAGSGAINIHGSVLPKYRGTSPIHGVLLNNESETGITIMLMDEEMDHGPILKTRSLNIAPDDTFSVLEEKLVNLASSLILEVIPEYLSGNLPPIAQDHETASFTKIIVKDDGKIDWKKSVQDIYNQYRAYEIWPGIWTIYEGKNFKIKKCRLSLENGAAEPGIIWSKDDLTFVQCRIGSLELLEVQPEGKNSVNINDFLRGHKSFVGSRLG